MRYYAPDVNNEEIERAREALKAEAAEELSEIVDGLSALVESLQPSACSRFEF